MNTLRITTLIFCLCLLFTGCKKDSGYDSLSNVVFSKDGVIRVECSDCLLKYTVLQDNYAVDVKNSSDIKFSYVSDFELKTTINSAKPQTIRLVVIDSYGRLISNQLTAIDPGAPKTDSFKIKIQ
ncbi:hypothetical protein HDF26_002708 [Pedobacter cryoconitis]|uniref:Lipoprotein n=1 Tax=Pedobacter cryoconitis TaxID=188932 RepID=A0A7W8ZIF5_9SPHI|nr:hypothetical protein [Pedobacter cryoconitis]MBB5634619.1 hypothetical protein [Pedobacter cryoconitis]MBB6272251.1 hypothetical protein [Pedobacter cryoconitis]